MALIMWDAACALEQHLYFVCNPMSVSIAWLVCRVSGGILPHPGMAVNHSADTQGFWFVLAETGWKSSIDYGRDPASLIYGDTQRRIRPIESGPSPEQGSRSLGGHKGRC